MELSPKSIFQVGFGFRSAKILLIAIQFSIFTKLSKNKAMSAIEIKTDLNWKCSDRGMYDILDSLVTLGFLKRQGILQSAYYMNSLQVDYFLDKNKPSYIGGIFQEANKYMYSVWGNLQQTLKTGKSIYQLKQKEDNLFKDVYDSPQNTKEFVSSMVGLQLAGFIKFAKEFDFSQYETLVDVGGSGATLSIEVSKQNPHLRCTNFDLSPVQKIAKENITNNGLEDKVFTQVGDFFKEELPKADVIVMGNILHDWSLQEKKGLIKKAFDAVNKGGAFVVIENIIDNERKKNLFGLGMSIIMLLETENGFDYSFCEFQQWVKAAGFTKTKLINLEGSVSAAVAYK